MLAAKLLFSCCCCKICCAPTGEVSANLEAAATAATAAEAAVTAAEADVVVGFKGLKLVPLPLAQLAAVGDPVEREDSLEKRTAEH